MADLRYAPVTLVFGADYNPDQWSKETWLEDIRLMKLAKVNLVTLPVFGWGQIEPQEGTFEFGWLDEVLELLYKNGINFNLATATATPPAWLVRKFPEILPMDFNGVRLEYGSRQSYCPSSTIFKERTRKLASKMAERYGRHPGLKFWHISNEYGDHVSRCYCPSSSSDFRDWLSAKYATVDAINQAWETKVWGQRYSHMDEIEPPRRSMGPNNPSQLLDFERFSSVVSPPPRFMTASRMKAWNSPAGMSRREKPMIDTLFGRCPERKRYQSEGIIFFAARSPVVPKITMIVGVFLSFIRYCFYA